MRLLLLLVAMIPLIASCGGDDGSGAAGPTADPEVEVIGAELFNQRVIGSNPGCVTCHSLDEGVTLVGPSLAGLAARAATSVPGLAAADYVRLSITDPDSFVVDGFTTGQMPGEWNEPLSDTQIESLVDFLLDL